MIENSTFSFQKATQSDVDAIMHIMNTAKSQAESGWFVADDETYVREHIEEKGFVMLARAEHGEAAGFFMIHIPGMGMDNLGRELGFSEKELSSVVHMDSAAVLPAFRGHRLQLRLLQAAEKELSRYPQYRYFLCTVHPDNQYSLHNMEQNGYQQVKTTKKYGGLTRHILMK